MLRRDHFLSLRPGAPHILPSLLLCDFGNLEREVWRLSEAGVTVLHLDVMDGQFVPNLTYGMPIVRALRGLTDMLLDVHLMIDRPERFIDEFFEAGADAITIHVEATGDARQVLGRIRQLGAAAGIALNPSTPAAAIDECLESCDLVLVMSVEAGFGGQSFNPLALERLGALRREHPEMMLEVDGGVNRETIRACADAGAELFVVGSAIFGHESYSAAISELKSKAVVRDRDEPRC